jgi:Rieske Fe-S protein
MSLWGKSESLAAGSGTVVINLSTKAVTGTNSTFLDTMVGKVITVGAAGTCGEAVIASRSSATAISIASTQFIVPDGSGNVTGVAYTVTEKPISTLGDVNYQVTEIYGVDTTEQTVANAASGEARKYAPPHAGWVGIQTYNDMHGNFRVKSETLVASSSITGDAADDAKFPDS